MGNPFFEAPILNSPYECPLWHWELDDQGQPTQQKINQRRDVRYVSPIPKPRKKTASSDSSVQPRLDLRGKSQCIYIDPPYGIKFNSNFQWSTASRDVKDGNVNEITREPEQVKAFRNTWRDGIKSYLTYLRDRLPWPLYLRLGISAFPAAIEWPHHSVNDYPNQITIRLARDAPVANSVRCLTDNCEQNTT